MSISKDNIQVSVVLPRKIVEECIDKDATSDFRTRSKQIAKIVIDYYKLKEK